MLLALAACVAIGFLHAGDEDATVVEAACHLVDLLDLAQPLDVLGSDEHHSLTSGQ